MKHKKGANSEEDEVTVSTDSPKFSKKINWPKSYKFSAEDSEGTFHSFLLSYNRVATILFEPNKEGKLIVRAGTVVKYFYSKSHSFQ